jgi:hypothetical protein
MGLQISERGIVDEVDEEVEIEAQENMINTGHDISDAEMDEAHRPTLEKEEEYRYSSPVIDTEQLDVFLDEFQDMEAMGN